MFPTNVLQFLLFAVSVSNSASDCSNFWKRWKYVNCGKNKLCLVGKKYEFLSIEKAVGKLNCLNNPLNEKLLKCANIKGIPIVYLYMHNCVYRNLNMTEFLHKHVLKMIVVTQESNHVHVTEISIHFRNITKLRKIFIQNIQTTSTLELTLTKLQKIETFYLSDSVFAEIRFNPFDKLPNLKKFGMVKCNTVNLREDALHQLFSLRTLHLYSNHIKDLKPLTFRDLINLKTLLLQDNNIKTITSEMFLNLTNLVRLNLANNLLLRMPQKLFFRIPNLKFLFIRENVAIEQFPKGFLKGAGRLQLLDASQCTIKNIEQDFFTDTAYYRREMSSNTILGTTAGNQSKQYKTEASTSKLEQTFRGHDFKIKRNNSTRDKNKTLNVFESLQTLILSWNMLEQIKDSTFEPLVNLKFIDLSHNLIFRLPSKYPFGPSEKLNSVILSYCHLTKFFESWIISNSTKLLALDNNKLEDLPSSLMQMVNYSPNITLQLKQNTWKCNCESLSLIKWMNMSIEKISDYEKVTCLDAAQNVFKIESYIGNISIGMSCDGLPFIADAAIHLKYEIILSIFFIPLLLLFNTFILYRNRLLFGSLIHNCISHSKKTPLREGKLFHVYLCYHKADRKIMKQLIKRLEPSIKCCIHQRDRIPVEGRNQMIAYSISHSNVTILIVSKKFLKNSWFQSNFLTVHHRLAIKAELKIYSILVGNIKEDLYPPDLRSLRSQQMSLKWKEKYFWEKLRYVLHVTSK